MATFCAPRSGAETLPARAGAVPHGNGRLAEAASGADRKDIDSDGPTTRASRPGTRSHPGATAAPPVYELAPGGRARNGRHLALPEASTDASPVGRGR